MSGAESKGGLNFKISEIVYEWHISGLKAQ